jgi:hypothetical protein
MSDAIGTLECPGIPTIPGHSRLRAESLTAA